MAKCRCSDIDKCREKIEKLQRVLNRFRNVDYYRGLISTEKMEASGKYASSFEGENTGTLCTDTEEIDSDMKSVRMDIGNRICQKISELQSDLSDMKDEDHRYHESKKKKKK